QPDDEQELPQPSDLQILPALVADPEPRRREELGDAAPLAEQAAEDHDREGAEQQVDPAGLVARLLDADDAAEKEGRRDIGRGDPEDRRLQVPGAQQVAREYLRQVEAVEIARLGPVVRQRAADQGLAEEQHRDDDEELDERLLAVGRLARNRARMDVPAAARPAEI